MFFFVVNTWRSILGRYDRFDFFELMIFSSGRMQSNRFAVRFKVVFLIITTVNPEHIEVIFHLIVKRDTRIVCDRNSHYSYHIDRKHIRSNVYTFNSMMILSTNAENVRNRQIAK